ncbi:MAG: tetratricopeptide repeat protein [Methylosarcina sp.]
MRFTTFVAFLVLSAQCVADSLMSSIQHIESEWASIYYQSPEQKKGDAYRRLLDKTISLSKQFPSNPEPLFWQAVIKATYADHQDAISALNAIKEARDLLLTVIRMNPKTMDGSAYVTLGTIYYMVPKWPVAFGDNEKAQKMLETALKINPDGIDSNYYFGDFLLTIDRPAEALKYLAKAAQAPARKEQLFADNQLKAEAQNTLNKTLAHLKNKDKTIFLSFLNSATIK